MKGCLVELYSVPSVLYKYHNGTKSRLGFHINIKNQPPTRRGMLNLVSSVYDPLGIASLVLIVKSILQNLCKRELDWDEEFPPKVLST